MTSDYKPQGAASASEGAMTFGNRLRQWFAPQPSKQADLTTGVRVRIREGNHGGMTGVVVNRQVDPSDGRIYYITRVTGLRYTYAYTREQLERLP